MSPDNCPRVFEANPRASHPRIAIGINEINLAAEEDVTVIRAPRDKNQHADENDFRQEGEAPPHAAIIFCHFERICQAGSDRGISNYSALEKGLEISRPRSTSQRGWSPEVCYVLLLDRGGPVAQRLEQGTHNPLVPGSNPGGPSFCLTRSRRGGGETAECWQSPSLPSLQAKLSSSARISVAHRRRRKKSDSSRRNSPRDKIRRPTRWTLIPTK